MSSNAQLIYLSIFIISSIFHSCKDQQTHRVPYTLSDYFIQEYTGPGDFPKIILANWADGNCTALVSQKNHKVSRLMSGEISLDESLLLTDGSSFQMSILLNQLDSIKVQLPKDKMDAFLTLTPVSSIKSNQLNGHWISSNRANELIILQFNNEDFYIALRSKENKQSLVKAYFNSNKQLSFEDPFQGCKTTLTPNGQHQIKLYLLGSPCNDSTIVYHRD